MARASRREELLTAALELFVERGYEGTSFADLAERTDLSKAAFVYHFDSKEDLLIELAEPLIDDLEDVLGRHRVPVADDQLQTVLDEYLGVLNRHQAVARWVDGDKSVLNHARLGARLDASNEHVHRILCGPSPSATARALASAVLGMLWRPVRNGHMTDDPNSRRAIVELATNAARSV